MSKKISRTKAVELITNTKGKFFTVTFITKDKRERTINGNVKQNCITKLGYINMYSMKDKGYRNVNPKTISNLKVNNTNYKIK